jgi:hypothetical protein
MFGNILPRPGLPVKQFFLVVDYFLDSASASFTAFATF